MAVYLIFPQADATLYSRYPLKNTGRDPILEVSVDNSQDGLRFLNRVGLTQNPYYTYDLAANSNFSTSDAYFPTQSIKRSVLQFSAADINKLKTYASQSVSGAWSASLNMYLASAQNLNTTYSLEFYPVSQSWIMGTGQYAQVPESRNGVSWTYTGEAYNSPSWVTGGGTWNANFQSTQSFDYMSNKDINVGISNIVNQWFSGSISNYGIIVKHPAAIEQNTASFMDLKFFSVDTHTIYPPSIQFKWDDSYYYPQGTNYVLSNEISVVLANNPGIFRQNEVYKMRTGVRNTYPARQFTTSSVYLNQLYFSENTYWALQDVKTDEMVVDFDTRFTKMSADSVSNYFTLYTSGLEINRYYRILIKTNIYSTTYGPLSVYNNEQSIYNALSLYGAEQLQLLPAEEVIFTNQNLVFKIVG
jgi:hypothetical protein